MGPDKRAQTMSGQSSEVMNLNHCAIFKQDFSKVSQVIKGEKIQRVIHSDSPSIRVP